MNVRHHGGVIHTTHGMAQIITHLRAMNTTITISLSSPPQVLSRDSVTVTVDAVVYYRVSNPTMATNNVEDFRYCFSTKHDSCSNIKPRIMFSKSILSCIVLLGSAISIFYRYTRKIIIGCVTRLLVWGRVHAT